MDNNERQIMVNAAHAMKRLIWAAQTGKVDEKPWVVTDATEALGVIEALLEAERAYIRMTSFGGRISELCDGRKVAFVYLDGVE